VTPYSLSKHAASKEIIHLGIDEILMKSWYKNMPTSKLLRYHYIETLLNIDGLDEISTPNVRILKEDKNICTSTGYMIWRIWSNKGTVLSSGSSLCVFGKD